MEMKPGYKRTELGVIPEDWSVVSAFDACSKIQDGTHFSPRISGNDYFYVTSKNIRFGYLDISTATRIDAAQHQAIYRRCDVKKGDLLLTKDGANTGNAALNTLDEEFSLLSSVAFLRFQQSKHCAAYFLQQVLTSQGQRQIQDAMAGNAITRLTLEKIKKLLFPLPPSKAEQEAIAEALSDADALIKSLEQLLAKKRRLKQGAMQELLTGKKRLPGFSGEWEVKTFKKICWFQEGPGVRNTQFTASGIKLLNGTNIFRGALNLDSTSRFISESEAYGAYAHFLADAGDIVIASSGITIERFHEKVAFVREYDLPFCMNTSTIRFKPFTGVLVSDFLFQFLTSDSFKQAIGGQATGSAQLNFGPSHVAKVPISLPPYSEQTAIAAILSDMDAEIAALEGKLAKTRSLKQGMMQELLIGRIRLLRPASKVVPLSAERKSAATTTKSHNWQINEAVVISVLAKHFGSEQWPLGRKRYTKLAYLLHRHVEREAEGYLKKAAGPYNPATKYKGPEGIALENRYVRFHSRDKFSGFVAAEKIGEAESYFSKWYGGDVLVWLEQFRRKSNDELELLATVDMAMDDLGRGGKAVALATVKQVIQDHPEWEAKLDRDIFSNDNINRAIQSCRQLFPAEGSRS